MCSENYNYNIMYTQWQWVFCWCSLYRLLCLALNVQHYIFMCSINQGCSINLSKVPSTLAQQYNNIGIMWIVWHNSTTTLVSCELSGTTVQQHWYHVDCLAQQYNNIGITWIVWHNSTTTLVSCGLSGTTV